ncbi:Disease resistance protein Roq1, partial [Linum grandiflorum]
SPAATADDDDHHHHPSLLEPKYDVFISFRGEDVCESFLSHLYTNLNDHKKMRTYMDSMDLARGEQISDALRNAIEVSRVYVAIFSPNYAESEWCLEELVMVLDCTRT